MSPGATRIVNPTIRNVAGLDIGDKNLKLWSIPVTHVWLSCIDAFQSHKNNAKLVAREYEVWPAQQTCTWSDQTVLGLYWDYYASMNPRAYKPTVFTRYYGSWSCTEIRPPTSKTNIWKSNITRTVESPTKSRNDVLYTIWRHRFRPSQGVEVVPRNVQSRPNGYQM